MQLDCTEGAQPAQCWYACFVVALLISAPYVLQDIRCEFEVTLSSGHRKLYFRCDSIAERDSLIHVLRTLAQSHGSMPHESSKIEECKQIQHETSPPPTHHQ